MEIIVELPPEKEELVSKLEKFDRDESGNIPCTMQDVVDADSGELLSIIVNFNGYEWAPGKRRKENTSHGAI